MLEHPHSSYLSTIMFKTQQLEMLYQATVLMESCGLQEDQQFMKDVLKYVSTELGGQCVLTVVAIIIIMIIGLQLMLL